MLTRAKTTGLGCVPPRPLRLALAALLAASLTAPCHAARSGFRPKVTITVHDTGTPPIGNR